MGDTCKECGARKGDCNHGQDHWGKPNSSAPAEDHSALKELERRKPGEGPAAPNEDLK